MSSMMNFDFLSYACLEAFIYSRFLGLIPHRYTFDVPFLFKFHFRGLNIAKDTFSQ